MNSHEEGRAKMIKQCRREILGALAIMYSIGPFSFESICSALTHLELPDDTCVKNDLTYLCERGYVRWTNEKPLMTWKTRLFKLTARGKDVHDRIEADPTLEP